MKKALGVGNSSFVSLIEDQNYYVDKTGFIKVLLESGKLVQLLTRPRRFGKTLFMDTLATFLSVNPVEPNDISLQEKLFAGLAVCGEKAFCRRWMGRVPTLFLSLKDIESSSFESAFAKLTVLLSAAAQDHAYLLDSPRLTPYDKKRLEASMNLSLENSLENRMTAENFLKDLLACLAKHYEHPAILLIDEYDVPLAKAALGGYYSEMVMFMKGFLSVLKPESSPKIKGRPILGKAVLTGCLRVSKESIFTGLNNLSVNTVCSEANAVLSSVMGFTESEVSDMLSYYGLQSRSEDVRRWYDGYRIGGEEIFCPWDVINFCDAAETSSDPESIKPQNYWAGTSSNDVIDEFLNFLSEADAERMQTLMDGGEIVLKINEQLSYSDFSLHRSDDFWTLLLFTGYLTVVRVVDANAFALKIPNTEIRDTFKDRVHARFSSENQSFAQYGKKFAKAALAGDVDGILSVLSPLLKRYVSVRDAASRAPAENYYQGFLTALLASAGGLIENFRSNAEAGDGYADIVFTSSNHLERIGVIIEIKRAGRNENMFRILNEALKKVDDKNYNAICGQLACRRYYTFALVFQGKHCLAGGGTLRTYEGDGGRPEPVQSA